MRRCLVLLLLPLLLSSCRSIRMALATAHGRDAHATQARIHGRDAHATPARFFVESHEPGASDLVLPQSGVRVAVASEAAFTLADVADVELAQLEFGKALLFQMTSEAARQLADLSGGEDGRRLVLVADETPIGALRLSDSIRDGRLYMFVEKPESELAEMVADLKSSAAARRAGER